jgi:molecular chaperone DnaK (HSP70)
MMAIIGIDLGRSNSAAAVLRGGRPVIIPSAEGISSCVYAIRICLTIAVVGGATSIYSYGSNTGVSHR